MGWGRGARGLGLREGSPPIEGKFSGHRAPELSFPGASCRVFVIILQMHEASQMLPGVSLS